MDWMQAHGPMILDSLVYSVLGVVILFVAFWIAAKLLPFSLRKEIEEDQNVAVAIIMAALILGISVIIAAVVA